MIRTEEVAYPHGSVLLRGFLALPEETQVPRPAVLIAPDWQGRNQSICDKAIEIANLGYVAFALDMYGDAKVGRDKIENRQLMTPLRENRAFLIERMQAAFDVLTARPEVNQEKIAAIGYCFGGLCVLDLARSGAALQAAVSFHGLLDAPDIYWDENIQASILILHGFDDPLVPPEQIDNFAEEMNRRSVDWQLHSYGLTAHSFTNPLANDDEMGLHYNPIAARRAWAACCRLLREALI